MIAAFGVLGVCLLAYVVSEIVRRDGQSWPLLDNWGVAVFEIIASGLCIARALIVRRGRRVALMLGLGLLSWATGDLVLAIESVGGAVPPTPSLADVFYLAFYPLSYAGVMLVLREQVKRFSLATWLDGAVAGFGAAALCAAFAFHGILEAAGGSAAAVITNLAFPIGDLLLVGLVVGGSAVLPSRRSAPWLLLAAGYAVNAVGDTSNLLSSSFGSSHTGMLFNAVAWPTSILLVAAAVWLRPDGHRPRVDLKVGFLLPSLAAVAALAILFAGSFEHIGRVALSLAAATLVIAGGRFILSLRSLRALHAHRHLQAVTDELTGVGNRRALTQLLDPFLAAQADADTTDTLAFLFLDLNRFKEVNDSFGHPAGDELLTQLGTRIKDSLRSSDLVVRLGGDEFAVAVVGAGSERAENVAKRLIARIKEPFLLDSVQVKLRATIGIAIVPTDAVDAPGIMACADRAMYRAKLAGREVALYREDLDGAVHGLHLVEELQEAIERRQLELHYQPQLDLSSGEIVAVEALVRWPHPRLGLVPPLEFLPLAEEAGLMDLLTALVLDKALTQCAAWRAAGRHLTVSVNVSTTNLIDPGFPDHVAAALERHGLPARALVLEITETTAIADFDRCKHAIEALHGLGLEVSVDDFGAGFTSLTYLSSLAVSELKLDRTFIVGLARTNGGRNLALVRATIALAHAIGLRVVAEGIEDKATLHILGSLGCDLAQGYLISKPKRASELSFDDHRTSLATWHGSARAQPRSAFLAPKPQLALDR